MTAQLDTNAALVLLSGGQDSTVVLASALERFSRVETVGFDYGQRHKIELACRREIRSLVPGLRSNWAGRLGEDHMIDLSVLGILSETALTRDRAIAFEKSGLPNTFVPGRNLLFFTFAAAIAYRRGIAILSGGMCETDFSGYPDCRDVTLKSLERSLSLGLDADFVVDTPLMFVDKAKTWAMAESLGGHALVDLILEETHSCYLGDRTVRHDWGYGCGTCPACQLRARGYSDYRFQSQ